MVSNYYIYNDFCQAKKIDDNFYQFVLNYFCYLINNN